MPIVIVTPDNLEIDVSCDETLMSAAQRQGFHWPTVCWGQAECMVCAVKVTAGVESTIMAAADEKKAIRERVPKMMQSPSTRLACRLRVNGDGVLVEKPGVRRR